MYLIRWRFDFLEHPSKMGQWSRPATRQEDMAAFCLKPGLVRASIEGKDFHTREIKTLAEVDGWDYCVFKWLAMASVPGNFRGTFRPISKLFGLQIVAREREISVFPDGTVKITPRDPLEKKLNYATYGK